MVRKQPTSQLTVRRFTILVFAAIVIIVVLTYILRQFSIGKKDITVWFTPNGAEPSELMIRKGTTVTFRTKTRTSFWPASNFHPLHMLYPEFDARQSIEATGSWQFTFNIPGKWRFHDHLAPSRGGVIRVVDAFGRSYNPVCSKKDNPGQLTDSELFSCWIADIENILDTRGLPAAFEYMSEIYTSNPRFSSACHDLTHIVGEAAYRLYEQKLPVQFNEETATCGWGFFHGFLEALFQNGETWKSAVTFCNTTQDTLKNEIVAPNAIYSCYHGIGHGVFDAQDSGLWGDDIRMVESALGVCKSEVGESDEMFVKQCASGVFNSLANAYAWERYGLSFNEQNPLRVCLEQSKESFRYACFMEVPIGFIRKQGWGSEQALSYIGSISDHSGAASAMYAYVSDEVRLKPSSGRDGTWQATCDGMDTYLAVPCVEGIAWGILGYGEPKEEWKDAVSYCNDIKKETLRETCFSFVLQMLSSMYSHEKTKEICESIDERYMKYCLR